MSRTFTSRPSCQARTRASTRSSENQPEEVVDRGSKSSTTARGRGQRRSSYRGRGHSMNRNSNIGLYGQSMNRNSNTGLNDQSLNRSNNTGLHNDGPSTAEPQEDLAQRGHYAGGFTMFAPNARKREQISQMAQRETQAYEQHRQNNAVKYVSHVGTVGGGEHTEDQVRATQAVAIRNQKFNRLKQQEEQKQARKREEDLKIEKMRTEARRKAEQNAARAARDAPAAEVRRNREAFLQQFEKRAPVGAAPTSTHQATASQRKSQTSAEALYKPD